MVNIARKILILFLVAQDIYINQIRGSANLYNFFYFFWNALMQTQQLDGGDIYRIIRPDTLTHLSVER